MVSVVQRVDAQQEWEPVPVDDPIQLFGQRGDLFV
jgi:hypothetical protein